MRFRKSSTFIVAIPLMLQIIGCKKIKNDIAILFTNDINAQVEQTLLNDDDGIKVSSIGFASLASIKKQNQQIVGEGNLLLVDAGNHLQGKPIGTIDKGNTIVDLMNDVGYDIANVGHREYSYNVDNIVSLSSKANFKYLSSNFVKGDENVFTKYFVKDLGQWKVGFLSITSPEAISKNSPYAFQDENKNFIYSFNGDEQGDKIASIVQDTINIMKEGKTDLIILLSDLNKNNKLPYTSENIVSKTFGCDAVFECSYDTSTDEKKVENKNVKVKNKLGDEIPILSCKNDLRSVGKYVLSKNGGTSISFIENYKEVIDKEKGNMILDKIGNVRKQILKEIASTYYPLVINDSSSNLRRIRKGETNLGDLIADAYQNNASGNDFGFINGGNLKSNIRAGGISLNEILEVLPYQNSVRTYKTKGQVILDALEYSVHKLSRTTNTSTIDYSNIADEFAGFLQISSNLSFYLDTTVVSPVEVDINDTFVEIDEGPRRISNVKVKGLPLDPNADYQFSTTPFLIEEGGDGYKMFKMNENTFRVGNDEQIDYKVVEKFLDSFPANKDNIKLIPATYSSTIGDNRIIVYK